MSANYVNQSDMSAMIPAEFLTQALDDTNSGTADPAVWDSVQASVQAEIDGTLSIRYSTPFNSPVPSVVLRSAQVLAAALLYQRRGIPEKDNPYSSRASDVRKNLALIAAGDLPLDPNQDRARPPVSVISQPSLTHSRFNRINT